MKKLIVISLMITILLTSCGNWTIDIPNVPSPFPSATPVILSPTPKVVTPTLSATPEITTPTLTETPTETLTATLTEFPTETPTTSPVGTFTVEVLGCNTSIDITHGMGEVTNAYVVLKNKSENNLENVCATLFALDEGRQHPDKTVCVPLLESGFQVSLKLTVDSTYKEETPIQVDVTNNGILLAREGEAACRDIGLFSSPPSDLLTPMPVP